MKRFTLYGSPHSLPPFSSPNENYSQSLSSRLLPTTIAGVPRLRCRCWILTLLIAVISVLLNLRLRIYSAMAT